MAYGYSPRRLVASATRATTPAGILRQYDEATRGNRGNDWAAAVYQDGQRLQAMAYTSSRQIFDDLRDLVDGRTASIECEVGIDR